MRELSGGNAVKKSKEKEKGNRLPLLSLSCLTQLLEICLSQPLLPSVQESGICKHLCITNCLPLSTLFYQPRRRRKIFNFRRYKIQTAKSISLPSRLVFFFIVERNDAHRI